MAKLNIKFGTPKLEESGNTLKVSIPWEFRGLSRETMSLLLGLNKTFIEEVTVKPEDGVTELSPFKARNIGITKAKEHAYTKAAKMLSKLGKLTKNVSTEANEAAYYLWKTSEREKIYTAQISDITTIKLPRRYGEELYLIKDIDGNYLLRGEYHSLTVSFMGSSADKKTHQIRSIDPEGGPFLSVGATIPGTTEVIKKIRKSKGTYKFYV